MAHRVITTIREFETLKPVWDELFLGNPNHTPFQTWEWNFTWWQNFGTEGALRLILMEEEGMPIGIAPLCLRKRFYGWPMPHLGFLGQKRTDYLDFVVAPEREAQFFRNLREYLHSTDDKWQFVELKDMPDSSTNLTPLFQELSEEFSLFSIDLQRVCVTIPLTSDWPSFLQTLGKRTRKDVNYDRRYLAKRFTVDFKIYTNSSTVVEGFRDLTAIYETRWQHEKGASRLAEQKVANFEKEICNQFSKRGDYRLYMLYADAQPVAGLSGYVRNNKYYGDIYAHSPELHKFSVGNVLLGMAIEDCISQNLSELDLSRGDETYKFRWNGRAKRNYHIKIFRNRMASAKAALAEALYEAAAQSRLLNNLRASYRRWRYRQ